MGLDAIGVEWQTCLNKFCMYYGLTNRIVHLPLPGISYQLLTVISLLQSVLTIICCQIDITELDDFAQAAFHGYKSLNRIQSRIYHTVYYTNENILVRHFIPLIL